METKDILVQLRKKYHLTQEEMAKRLLVTRQALSRWENGETIPNIDTMKLLSAQFGLSINTLLGSPRKLVCQCCGMPLLEDAQISREEDGAFNEEYCRWCYHDGAFVYDSMEKMMDFCQPMMAEHYPQKSAEELRKMMETYLSDLSYWKKKQERK